MTPEKRLELITHGRSQASAVLEHTCTNAVDTEDMFDQLESLGFMSNHILATHAYNEVRQNKTHVKDVLKKIFRDIEDEYYFLISVGKDQMHFKKPPTDKGLN